MERKNQKKLYRWKGMYLKRYLTFLLAMVIAITSIPLNTIWAEEQEYSEHPGEANGVTEVNRVELYEDGETKEGRREDGNWQFTVRDNGTYSFTIYYDSKDEEEIADVIPSKAENLEAETTEAETTEAETTEAETKADGETGSTEEESQEESTEPETAAPEPEESTDSTEEAEEPEDSSQESSENSNKDESEGDDNNSGSEGDSGSNSDSGSAADSEPSEESGSEDSEAGSQGTESIVFNAIDLLFPVIEAYAKDNIVKKAIVVEYEVNDLVLDMQVSTPSTAALQYISFTPLDAEIAEQHVKTGTMLEELVLPEALEAVNETGDVLSVNVSWEPETKFESRTAGNYVFNPVLPSEYMVEEGSAAPQIKVEMGTDNLKIIPDTEYTEATIYHMNTNKFDGANGKVYSEEEEELENLLPAIERGGEEERISYEIAGQSNTMAYKDAEFEFHAGTGDGVNPVYNMAGIGVGRNFLPEKGIATKLRLRYTTNKNPDIQYLFHEDALQPKNVGLKGDYTPDQYVYFCPNLGSGEYLTSAAIEFGTLQLKKSYASFQRIYPLFFTDGRIRPDFTLVKSGGESKLGSLDYAFTYGDGTERKKPSAFDSKPVSLVCKPYREYIYKPELIWQKSNQKVEVKIGDTIKTGIGCK